MHAIIYESATGAVVGVVRDAVIDGQRITGSNMSMVTSAPYLLVETDPWEITNVSELSDAAVLAGVKAAKIAEIQAASNAAIAMLEAGYTQGEVKSFDRQRQGALDILAENTTTADAQYVAALAAARTAAGDSGCTTAWLAQQIKDNADTAAAYTIQILGKQQGLEATVRAAATVEDVEAVEW